MARHARSSPPRNVESCDSTWRCFHHLRIGRWRLEIRCLPYGIVDTLAWENICPVLISCLRIRTRGGQIHSREGKAFRDAYLYVFLMKLMGLEEIRRIDFFPEASVILRAQVCNVNRVGSSHQRKWIRSTDFERIARVRFNSLAWSFFLSRCEFLFIAFRGRLWILKYPARKRFSIYPACLKSSFSFLFSFFPFSPSLENDGSPWNHSLKTREEEIPRKEGRYGEFFFFFFFFTSNLKKFRNFETWDALNCWRRNVNFSAVKWIVNERQDAAE